MPAGTSWDVAKTVCRWIEEIEGVAESSNGDVNGNAA